MCQLAFGGGFARRTFYTNDERSVIYAQRPVVLVGIGDFVVRGDLRDRSVFLHLPPIPETSMLAERTFWNWSGTVQQLYERITKTAGNRLGSNWPKNYSTFGAEFRRIAPQLRVHGISVNFERTRDARIVTVRAERSKSDGLQPNAPGP